MAYRVTSHHLHRPWRKVGVEHHDPGPGPGDRNRLEVPGGFAGCWNPRLIRSVTGAPTAISRHTWGAAWTSTPDRNRWVRREPGSSRPIDVMLEWAFILGGDWLVPDPMHFEYEVPPG